MRLDIRRVRALLLEVPRQGELAYSLLRDPRVSPATKGALLAALGIIVSPLDIPAWVPVIGELDMLALSMVAVKVFIEACPPDVVADNLAAIEAGESPFRRDLLRAGLLGRAKLGSVWNQIRERRRIRDLAPIEVRPQEVGPGQVR